MRTKTILYGVFHWHEDPRYHFDTPLVICASEKAAQKVADGMNERDARINAVVRYCDAQTGMDADGINRNQR